MNLTVVVMDYFLGGDVADENGLDYTEDSAEIDELYIEEMESWIECYAVLEEEDEDLDPEDKYYM